MNKTSVFNIRIDVDKSQGSYVFDKNTNKKYLDFMGMYSSLPLGYNHEIFYSNDWQKDIKKISKLKIVNCEMLSDEFDEFNNEFIKFAGMGKYNYSHYTCTGALANEAAVKAAMWYKGPKKDGYILSIKNSFHGINSVGNLITTRFSGVDLRLGNIPGQNLWPCVENIDEAIKYISNGSKNLQGIIVEPIQATYGDNYLKIKKLKELREICTKCDIPLIFDEVQTGFCSTGKVWYCQHLGIEPDIITFGKKSQVSGIIVKDSHSSVFEIPKRLSVTFDGDLVDMVRCKYIIQAIKDYDLLDNVNNMGLYFRNQLEKFTDIKNIRNTGLLFAFDFENKINRDSFIKKLYNNGMICNPTGNNSIRMRPNLAVNKKEIDTAIKIIGESL
jgi:L-lysine 6-transaminase